MLIMAKVIDWLKANYDRAVLMAAAVFLFICAIAIWWGAIQFNNRLITPPTVPPKTASQPPVAKRHVRDQPLIIGKLVRLRPMLAGETMRVARRRRARSVKQDDRQGFVAIIVDPAPEGDQFDRSSRPPTRAERGGKDVRRAAEPLVIPI